MKSPQLGQLYARLAGDRAVRGLAGFEGRRKVKARSLLPRRWHHPTVIRRDGMQYFISDDPLDAEIIDSILNRRRDVYFPTSLSSGDVHLVLEVGAHHGLYTVAAASEYPAAKIIACEPSITALPIVHRQISINDLHDRVEVIPAGLSGEAGTAQLSHEPSGSWGATLYQPDVVTSSESVVTLTLEQMLRLRTPDIIKSNAEGAEFELIAQLSDSSVRPKMLILAVHHEYGDVESLRADVAKLGYEVQAVVDGHHPMWHCTPKGRRQLTL